MDARAQQAPYRWGTGNMPPNTLLYEVYPRSYQATNGSVGTINGLRQRLDHLERTGVRVVWLTPIFPSPMADFGYDVADYCDVDPLFGSLGDLQMLIAEAAAYGIEIMLDLVANHTSNEHSWFKESRSSRNNPKRDWYIWRDPAPDGGPPNNWLAVFGGSAWEFDPETGQYYLHSFLPSQPDLNWENPEVQEAMRNILRFWSERGVRLWRVDAMDWTGKDIEHFRDNPPNPDFVPGPDASPYDAMLQTHTMRMPNHFRYLNILGDVLREFNGFMVVETYPPGKDLGAEYRHIFDNYPTDVAAPLLLSALIYRPFTAASLAEAIPGILTMMRPGETPVWISGTHDVSRVTSRLPDPEAARLMLMLLMLLPGVRVMYYGEEIGMTDGVIPPDRVQDPFELRVPGRGLGRDPNRTVMQWSGDPYAGFSNVEPWLPVADSYTTLNVDKQSQDPQSMLALTLALREFGDETAAIIDGDYAQLKTTHDDVFGFARAATGERYLVLLNISGATVQCAAANKGETGALIMTSKLDLPEGSVIDLASIELRPWEGYVVKA